MSNQGLFFKQSLSFIRYHKGTKRVNMKNRFFINMFIVVIVALFGVGCDEKGTIDVSDMVSGKVAKGSVSGATVTIYEANGTTQLAQTTTNDKGEYRVAIDYKGVVKAVATGGSYIDEIVGTNVNVAGNLTAYSSLQANRTVNITPYTTIVAKQIKNSAMVIDDDLVTSANTIAAQKFIGEAFDITKVTPKILKKDGKLDNTNEGKYGIALAVFSQIAGPLSANFQPKITEFYDDIKTDGLLDNIDNQIQTALRNKQITDNADNTAIDDINSTSISQELKDKVPNVAGSLSKSSQQINSTTTYTLDISDIDTALPISIDKGSFTVGGKNSLYVQNGDVVVVSLLNSPNIDTETIANLKIGDNTFQMTASTANKIDHHHHL